MVDNLFFEKHIRLNRRTLQEDLIAISATQYDGHDT